MDIATLGYAVDTKGLKSGETAIDAFVTANMRAVKAANDVQKSVRNITGLDRPFKEAAASAEVFGSELDRLRAKYNPVFAASRQYKTELEGLRSALKVGAVSQKEYMSALGAMKGRYRALGTGAGKAKDAMRLTTHEMVNIQYQLNDMATMMASGQAPFTMMMQQGMQISQIFGARGAGVGSALKAVGAGISSFLLNPLNLTVVGIAAVAGAIPLIWQAVTGGESKTAEDVLNNFNDLLEEIEKQSPQTAKAIKGIVDEASKLPMKTLEVKAKTNLEDIKEQVKSQVNNITKIIESGKFGIYAEFQGAPLTPEIEKYITKIDEISKSFLSADKDARKFSEEIAKIQLDPNVPNEVKDVLGKVQDAITKGVSGGILSIEVGGEGAKGIIDLQAALEGAGEAARRTSDEIGAMQGPPMNEMIKGYMERTKYANLELSLIGKSNEEKAVAIARQKAINELSKQKVETTKEERDAIIRAAEEEARAKELLRVKTGEYEQIDRDRESREKLIQSINDQVAAAEFERSIIGKTNEDRMVAIALRETEARLIEQNIKLTSAEGQVALDAAEKAARIRAQTQADVEQANKIKQEAQARERLTQSYQDQLAMAQLEASLIGATDEQRSVAIAHMQAEIQLRRQNIDLQSTEAQNIINLAEQTARLNVVTNQQSQAANKALQAHKQAYEQIQSIGKDAINSLVDAVVDGNKSVEDILKDMLKQIAKMLLTLGFANPLQNALFGSNLPTAQSMGGLGNVLGALVGGGGAGIGGASTSGVSMSGGQNMFTQFGSTVQSAVTSGITNATRIMPAANTNFGLTGTMGQYASAIRAIESRGSGGYSALGPLTSRGDRAYGAYQIMGSNIGPWSKSALGRSITPEEFMANPRLQDQIFQNQFGKYVSKYGNPQDAASTWFTGRPLSQGAGARDVLGTSGQQYVDKFNEELSKMGGTANSASNALDKLGNTTSDMAGTLGNAAKNAADKLGGEASQAVGELGSAAKNATSNLGSFAQQLLMNISPSVSGSSWFQGLSSMFGGAGGAVNYMMGISPAATANILSGGVGLYAKGGIFNHGEVTAFANGGVVDRPTNFSFAGGMGLMGEAGPEAIMPLTRGPDGKLGVRMHQGIAPQPGQQQSQTQGNGKQQNIVVHNNFIVKDRASTPRSQNQIASNITSSFHRAARTA